MDFPLGKGYYGGAAGSSWDLPCLGGACRECFVILSIPADGTRCIVFDFAAAGFKTLSGCAGRALLGADGRVVPVPASVTGATDGVVFAFLAVLAGGKPFTDTTAESALAYAGGRAVLIRASNAAGAGRVVLGLLAVNTGGETLSSTASCAFASAGGRGVLVRAVAAPRARGIVLGFVAVAA